MLLSTFLADTIGRKATMFSGSVIHAAIIFAQFYCFERFLSLSEMLPHEETLHCRSGVVALFFVARGSVSMALQAQAIYISECFPTGLR